MVQLAGPGEAILLVENVIRGHQVYKAAWVYELNEDQTLVIQRAMILLVNYKYSISVGHTRLALRTHPIAIG